MDQLQWLEKYLAAGVHNHCNACALVLHGGCLLPPLQQPDAMQTGVKGHVLNHITITTWCCADHWGPEASNITVGHDSTSNTQPSKWKTSAQHENRCFSSFNRCNNLFYFFAAVYGTIELIAHPIVYDLLEQYPKLADMKLHEVLHRLGFVYSSYLQAACLAMRWPFQ